jgi:hypothetical protein
MSLDYNKVAQEINIGNMRTCLRLWRESTRKEAPS